MQAETWWVSMTSAHIRDQDYRPRTTWSLPVMVSDVPPLSQNNGPTRESQTSEDDMDVEDGKITPHRHAVKGVVDPVS
jgi:hypothetical protein